LLGLGDGLLLEQRNLCSGLFDGHLGAAPGHQWQSSECNIAVRTAAEPPRSLARTARRRPASRGPSGGGLSRPSCVAISVPSLPSRARAHPRVRIEPRRAGASATFSCVGARFEVPKRGMLRDAGAMTGETRSRHSSTPMTSINTDATARFSGSRRRRDDALLMARVRAARVLVHVARGIARAHRRALPAEGSFLRP
jgi:hypothetical protein